MTRAFLAFAFVIALSSCRHQSRADEIIAALEKQGLRVEKGIARPNEFDWDMNMELILDGQRGYLAVRFESTKGSQDYCRTNRGVVVDYWCLTSRHPPEDPAWQKVKKVGDAFSF